MTTASLHLLGGFDARIDGRPVRLDLDAQRVLAFLALRRTPQHPTTVAAALWPGASGASPRPHGVLDLLPPAVTERLELGREGGMALGSEWLLDLDDALDAARRLHADPSPVGVDPLVFRLDLLPDWFEPWLFHIQHRYRRMRLSVLSRLGAHLLATGDHSAALAVAEELVAADELGEDGQYLLVAALAARGDHVGAHLRYARYCARLRLAWGVSPSARLVELVGRVQHPAAGQR